MALQIVRVGNKPNDGVGDSLRSGMMKINGNFQEIFAFLSGGDTTNLATVIPISRGGTGTSTVEGIQRALNLGDGALKSVGTGEGDLVVIGSNGFGTDLSPNVILSEKVKPSEYKSGQLSYFALDDKTVITFATRTSESKGQVAIGNLAKEPRMYVRGSNRDVFTKWFEAMTEANTIVTATGDLKFSRNSARVTNSEAIQQDGSKLNHTKTETGIYSIGTATLDRTHWACVASEGYTATVEQFGEQVRVHVKKDTVYADLVSGTWVDVHLL